jgi:hypothetical protein
MDELLPTLQALISLERTAVDCEHFTHAYREQSVAQEF